MSEVVIGEDAVLVPTKFYSKTLYDLARHRDAVAMAVAALESVLSDGQENYVGSGLDDARNALAVLKGLEGGEGTQTST